MGIARPVHGQPIDVERASNRQPTPMGYSWAAHAMPMDCQWHAQFGLSVGYPWHAHGVLMGCPWDGTRMGWDAHGLLHKDNQRISHGHPTDCPIFAHGLLMGIPRVSHGIPRASCRYPAGSPWASNNQSDTAHGHPVGIPWAVRGQATGSPWDGHRQPMSCPCGVPIGCRWAVCGLAVGCP